MRNVVFKFYSNTINLKGLMKCTNLSKRTKKNTHLIQIFVIIVISFAGVGVRFFIIARTIFFFFTIFVLINKKILVKWCRSFAPKILLTSLSPSESSSSNSSNAFNRCVSSSISLIASRASDPNYMNKRMKNESVWKFSFWFSAKSFATYLIAV